MYRYTSAGSPRFVAIWTKWLAILIALILTVSVAAPASAQSTHTSVAALNVLASTSTFRCYNAPFQFPVNGYLGWIWKDPAALPAPPVGDGHFHTGIDVWPFGGQGSPIYPLADGYIRRIGNGKGLNALNLWFPSVNGGTEVYYAHIKVTPSLIPPHNAADLAIEVNVPVKATDVVGTVFGENWVHLSIGSTNGPYTRHNDLDPNATQDPSSYFSAKFNYDAGDRSIFDHKSDALCDANRTSFPTQIAPGTTTTITKTIVTPQIPAKPDVVFLADTTGSMGGAIDNVRSRAATVMGEVRAVQSTAWFGVAEYKDFNCDAAPYTLNQAITADTNAAQSGINQWIASGGCDTPEAQLNALYRLATDIGSTGWRSDSSHIIAWFGDAPGHDPSNGVTLTSTINALKAARVRVIAVNVNALYSCGSEGPQTCNQATAITAATNGKLISINSAAAVARPTSKDGIPAVVPNDSSTVKPSSTSLKGDAVSATGVDDVSGAILEGLKSLPVTVEPQIIGCGPSITVTPDAPTKTVVSGEAATFIFTITVANNIVVGESANCQINFLADGALITDAAVAQPLVVTTSLPVTSNNLCGETQRYIQSSSLKPKQARLLSQALCAELTVAQLALRRGRYDVFKLALHAYIYGVRKNTPYVFTQAQAANLIQLSDYLG